MRNADMYNRYFSDNADAFSELYRTVEYENENNEEKIRAESDEKRYLNRNKSRFDLKRLLHGLDVEKMGIVPIVLLLLLLLDVDDEERIIIIALAVIFGI